MSTLPKTRSVIRHFQDFPKAGICFVDVTPIMTTPEALTEVVDALAERYSKMHLDAVAGLESRGFYFGVPLAMRLGLPFVPLRKPGKLPGPIVSVDYGKEYGTDQIQVQKDSFRSGARVLVVDDLLATGGTLTAALRLVDMCGARAVEACCVIELQELGGRKKVEETGTPFHSLIVS
eukprot:m51a1_g3062 adenine phosphoribosyltransferase, putative (177) ;mRNA; f:1004366-1004999